jgi:hypothetical protein
MEELAQGKPLSENLKVFHSELYDLYELDRRKEALRLIIGLLRLLSSAKRTDKRFHSKIFCHKLISA